MDVSAVPGTGRGGRVTKKDILGYIEGGAPAAPAPAEAPAAPAAAPPAEAPAPAPAAAPAAPVTAEQGESLEPMNAMRRGIAEHMRRSLDTAAHVTSAIEVDMSQIVAIRSKLKNDYQSKFGVNPTYLSSSRGPQRTRCSTTRGSTARSAATRSSRATTSTSASPSSWRTGRA